MVNCLESGNHKIINDGFHFLSSYLHCNADLHWVTRPERPKGPNEEVKRSKGPRTSYIICIPFFILIIHGGNVIVLYTPRSHNPSRHFCSHTLFLCIDQKKLDPTTLLMIWNASLNMYKLQIVLKLKFTNNSLIHFWESCTCRFFLNYKYKVYKYKLIVFKSACKPKAPRTTSSLKTSSFQIFVKENSSA